MAITKKGSPASATKKGTPGPSKSISKASTPAPSSGSKKLSALKAAASAVKKSPASVAKKAPVAANAPKKSAVAAKKGKAPEPEEREDDEDDDEEFEDGDDDDDDVVDVDIPDDKFEDVVNADLYGDDDSDETDDEAVLAAAMESEDDDDEDPIVPPSKSSKGSVAAKDEEPIDELALQDAIVSLQEEIKSGGPKKTLKERKKEKKAARAKAGGSPNSKTGVVYLGRIPHGFYEREMKAYFSQFGEVLRLRLSRNKKTGASKHYAFIEFPSPEIAQIVADTMQGYLLFSHILQCKVIPNEKLHPDTFRGWDRPFKVMPWNKIERQRVNRVSCLVDPPLFLLTLFVWKS
ncbi:hypothetical protein HDU79_000705 [Rhizoclosmatium sp. JEL0117]|nr:hypothetical protein HDU79_000705 [Rhizoclosmatium sp. JEL0117]